MNELAKALENADEASSNLDESRETRKLTQQLGIAKKACSALSDEFREIADEFQETLNKSRDSSEAKYEDAKEVMEELVEAIAKLKY